MFKALFALINSANYWEELCRANQQVLKIQPPQAGFRQVKAGLLRPRSSLVPTLNSLWQLRCIMFGHRECLLVDLLLEGIACCSPRLHQGAGQSVVGGDDQKSRFRSPSVIGNSLWT